MAKTKKAKRISSDFNWSPSPAGAWDEMPRETGIDHSYTMGSGDIAGWNDPVAQIEPDRSFDWSGQGTTGWDGLQARAIDVEDTTPAAAQPKKLAKAASDKTAGDGSSGGDLGASDWVGYGLQAAGALAAQSSADKAAERARADEQAAVVRDQTERAKMVRLQQEQQAKENAFREREQNMSGLNLLQGMVNSNRQLGRRMSFGSHLAKMAGY